MDDAALRAGRMTTICASGMDAAILAGVALLNEAFGVLPAASAAQTPWRADSSPKLSERDGSPASSAGQMPRPPLETGRPRPRPCSA
jgi:hypothetical protein